MNPIARNPLTDNLALIFASDFQATRSLPHALEQKRGVKKKFTHQRKGQAFLAQHVLVRGTDPRRHCLALLCIFAGDESFLFFVQLGNQSLQLH